MTAPFLTRRRAEELAAALEGADGAPGPGREPHPEVRRLVAVATALRSPDLRAAASPRPDFAADLRGRLMAEAEHVLGAEASQLRLPARRPGRRERRLAAAASAVVLLGGSAGMAVAAEQALPGEMLYPIKRGIERAQAELSVSPGGKGLDLLHQAEDRLSEVERLLASDAVEAEPQVPGTLEDFTAQAQEGADLLLSSYSETRDARDVVEVREFTSRSIETLTELADDAPASAQDDLTAAAMTLREIDSAAIELCDTCAPGIPALELPALFRVSADATRALTAADDTALDNSHPVEVDQHLLGRADALAGSTDGDPADQGTSGAQEGAGGAEAPGVPGGQGLPGDDTPLTGDDGPIKQLGDGLETGSEPLDDTVDTTTDTLDGAVEDVTEGLGDAVGTILPDPDDGGLLD